MDEIVSAVTYRDAVFIFTRSGKVYRMITDYVTGDIQFRLETTLFPR